MASAVETLIGPDDRILVTGATGFIGSRLVTTLLDHGFRHIRCFARPGSDLRTLDLPHRPGVGLEIVTGNLLSKSDCLAATKDVVVVFHLAAGRGRSRSRIRS